MQIKKLNSGGIIPTYQCPASCRHCLYGCNMKTDKDYIDKHGSEKLCKLLTELGAASMHIGGGEPFLDFAKMTALIKAMAEHDINVEYVETNAACCTPSYTDDDIVDMLKELKSLSANCLLISVDPFHIEYIPLNKTLRLIRLAEKANIDYFLWQEQYLRELLKLQADQIYSRAELEQELGADYIYRTANNYGLFYNGRALNIAREYKSKKNYRDFLDNDPCHTITGVSHFHADYNLKFIPPNCTGIAVDLEDIKNNNIIFEKYPVFVTLAQKGTAGLYYHAENHGFKANETGYVSKCDLCFDIRKYLINTCPTADLYPKKYYSSDF